MTKVRIDRRDSLLVLYEKAGVSKELLLRISEFLSEVGSNPLFVTDMLYVHREKLSLRDRKEQ